MRREKKPSTDRTRAIHYLELDPCTFHKTRNSCRFTIKIKNKSHFNLKLRLNTIVLQNELANVQRFLMRCSLMQVMISFTDFFKRNDLHGPNNERYFHLIYSWISFIFSIFVLLFEYFSVVHSNAFYVLIMNTHLVDVGTAKGNISFFEEISSLKDVKESFVFSTFYYTYTYCITQWMSNVHCFKYR